MNIVDSIMHRFGLFTAGVNVVMLIDRGVMNSNKGSKRWINKIITTNEAEYRTAVEKLIALQCHLNNPDIRLYASVNNRNLDKAIKAFNHRQLDLLADNKDKFYSRINDSFCSCLMQPENRGSRYFLLDVDSKNTNEVDGFIKNQNINVYFTYPTKNGWHYIVEPFNVTTADGMKTFIVNKDGLLLLHYLEDQNETT